jgi:hypothetical protein
MLSAAAKRHVVGLHYIEQPWSGVQCFFRWISTCSTCEAGNFCKGNLYSSYIFMHNTDFRSALEQHHLSAALHVRAGKG